MNGNNAVTYYREEASELLDRIESLLLELEKNPEDTELVNNVFRALHTIKGSGSMFGFEKISAFTHEVETLFDLIRKKELSIDHVMVDLTLAARDHIRILLEDNERISQEDEELGADLVRRFKAFTEKTKPEKSPQASVQPQPEKKPEADSTKTYRISFKPAEEIFLRGVKINLLFDELKNLGDFLAVAHTNHIPDLKDLNPELCYTSWTLIVTTRAGLNAVRDVFIFIEDFCELKIDIIDTGDVTDIEEDYKKIGEILLDQGHISRENLERILNRRDLFGNIALEEGIVTEDKLQSAIEEQTYIRDLRRKRKEMAFSTTIRVNNEKLDELVNLVGELVTLQARLSQQAIDADNSEVENIAESLERLTAELRDNTMNIRMIPLGETFQSFQRLVRDLSKELNKTIDLVSYGGETELDKNIIEMLKDPLVHIIRNCIDHGIESAEERKKAGKPINGTITVGAEYSGANVLIKISDDGGGINIDRVLGKAIEKGLVHKNADLSQEEMINLIFLPGFSTADKATSVSGRGVGMDVVKKNIENLRGSVEVTNNPGQGTSMLLRIPLTLSIIDGLLVKIGPERYVINLSIIEECVDMTEDVITQSNSGSFAKIRGDLVPFIRLRKVFGVKGQPDEREQMVIALVDNSRVGFVVDSVIGQLQTVIKPLNRAFKNLGELSGSTILGDGSIALILDINKISKTLEEKSAAAR